MIKFKCPCGADTYFDSTNCAFCGKRLGLNPKTWKYEFVTEEGHIYPSKSMSPGTICKNGLQYGVCNWIRDPRSKYGLCLSCSFNRYIPNLETQENISRWKILELAKRRLFFNLFRLNIRWSSRWVSPKKGLLFDFLEDSRTSPNIHPAKFVSTGYSEGIITINVLEADPAQIAAQKAANKEAYRTVLGHMRHESGHYVWDILQYESEIKKSFCRVFGNPDQDYEKALNKFYSKGQRPNWTESYITPYASSHPIEDWAETWGHYLHVDDGLETAKAFNLVEPNSGQSGVRDRLKTWQELTIKLNEMNRSMGLNDLYPFVINEPVIQKFEYIDEIIRALQKPDLS